MNCFRPMLIALFPIYQLIIREATFELEEKWMLKFIVFPGCVFLGCHFFFGNFCPFVIIIRRWCVIWAKRAGEVAAIIKESVVIASKTAHSRLAYRLTRNHSAIRVWLSRSTVNACWILCTHSSTDIHPSSRFEPHPSQRRVMWILIKFNFNFITVNKDQSAQSMGTAWVVPSSDVCWHQTALEKKAPRDHNKACGKWTILLRLIQSLCLVPCHVQQKIYTFFFFSFSPLFAVIKRQIDCCVWWWKLYNKSMNKNTPIHRRRKQINRALQSCPRVQTEAPMIGHNCELDSLFTLIARSKEIIVKRKGTMEGKEQLKWNIKLAAMQTLCCKSEVEGCGNKKHSSKEQ